MRDAFSSCHPITEALFFAGAVVLGVCIHHPVWSACAFVQAVLYLLRLKGRDSREVLPGILILMVLVLLINPLVNPQGETVLLTWLNGRPITLEACFYGAVTALMFGTVLAWFACYNEIMTGDKLLFLFGKAAPAVAMVLTMIFRLVPGYRRRAAHIEEARRGIGKASAEKDKRAQLSDSADRITALLGWALEDGVSTGESMQARGYGAGTRTFYAKYRFSLREQILTGGMVLLLAGLMVSLVKGAAQAVFIPAIRISGVHTPWYLTGLVFYMMYLAIPILLDLYEDILWHRSRSKI